MSLQVAPRGAGRGGNGGFSVEAMLGWLEQLPAEPSPDDVESLVQQLESLNAHRLRVGVRLDLSERIHAVAMRCRSLIESTPDDSNVPLTTQARTHARLLDAMFAGTAASYRILLAELSRRLFGLASSGRALLPVFRTMQLSHQRMVLAYRQYTAVPKGVWQEMHEMHQFALRRGLVNRTPTDLPETPSTIYRKALLTAFAEPQRLVRRDLERLLDLVEQQADQTAVSPWRSQAVAPGTGTFIIKPQRDVPGTFAGAQRQPSAQQGDLVFTCAAVIDRLHHIAQSAPQDAALIDALRKQWTSKPSRRLNRLQTHARVEIFVGLDRIWHFLSGERDERSAGHWIVTNESRNGFALMHTGESVEQLGVGDVVGLHAGNGRACHLCLVRWVVSDSPEQVEVGLEEISSLVRSVALANGNGEPVRALLLQNAESDARAATIVSSPVALHDRWELTIGALDSRLIVRPRSVRESTNLVQITDLEPDC